jgi:hypothetical protein
MCDGPAFAGSDAGCGRHGGANNSTASIASAGLTECDASVVFAEGTEIIPETVSNSGGAITQCSVSPSLPAGLVLDPQTCAITGTPKVVSPATIYTIPDSNAAVPHESRSKSRPTPLHRRRDAHD